AADRAQLDRHDRNVANALVRRMVAGGRKGSSGTVVGHACFWAQAEVPRRRRGRSVSVAKHARAGARLDRESERQTGTALVAASGGHQPPRRQAPGGRNSGIAATDPEDAEGPRNCGQEQTAERRGRWVRVARPRAEGASPADGMPSGSIWSVPVLARRRANAVRRLAPAFVSPQAFRAATLAASGYGGARELRREGPPRA